MHPYAVPYFFSDERPNHRFDAIREEQKDKRSYAEIKKWLEEDYDGIY